MPKHFHLGLSEGADFLNAIEVRSGNQTLGGTLRSLSEGGTYECIVNGKTVIVKATKLQDHSGILLDLKDGRIPVIFRELDGNNVELNIEGSKLVLRIERATAWRSSSASIPPRSPALGEEALVFAPMPGRVLSIMAKLGDRVKAGTPILVLEAMKMENEIASPIEGKLESLRVSENESVKRNQPLFSVKAHN